MALRAKNTRIRRTLIALSAVLVVAPGLTPVAAAAGLAPDEFSAVSSSASGLSPLAAVQAADEGSCHEGAPSYVSLPTELPVLALLQARSAWNITQGYGVTVAIVDSGVNGSDPRLKNALIKGINLVDDGADPNGWTDYYSHGTAIAGQIAAAPSEGSSLIGLAPGVKILPIRVYAGVDERTREAGHGPTTSRLVDGIRRAADQGAHIINVSISTESASDEVNAAVAYATSQGSLVIASAGNAQGDLDVSTGGTTGTTQVRYPAGSPGALGVTATTVPGNVVTDASVHGPHVDVAAPGQGVLTLGLNTGDCVFASDAPAASYSTAYVSAAAALIAAAYPNETPEQWAYRLTSTALRGNPDARNDTYGWGIIQPFQALTLVPGPDTRGPESAFFSSQEVVPAAPNPLTVEPPSNQHAVDLDRVLLVGVSAASVLALVGTIAAFRNRRSRANA